MPLAVIAVRRRGQESNSEQAPAYPRNRRLREIVEPPVLERPVAHALNVQARPGDRVNPKVS